MRHYLITREQFEKVRPLLDQAKKHTRPRQHDLYNVFSAILYRQQTGCSWRQLPLCFPPWRTVHEYSMQWDWPIGGGRSLLDRVLSELNYQPATKENQP